MDESLWCFKANFIKRYGLKHSIQQIFYPTSFHRIFLITIKVPTRSCLAKLMNTLPFKHFDSLTIQRSVHIHPTSYKRIVCLLGTMKNLKVIHACFLPWRIYIICYMLFDEHNFPFENVHSSFTFGAISPTLTACC